MTDEYHKLGGMVGYGIYQHHNPLCPAESKCGWCRRERARNTPERVALQQSLDSRSRVRGIVRGRAIERAQKGGIK